MKTSRVLMALVLMIPLAGSAAHAQLAAGSRIRVLMNNQQIDLYTGSFEGYRDSSLLLRSSNQTRAIPVDAIFGVQQSQGRKRSVAGGIAGALLGVGTGGFLLGCVANQDDYGVLCGGQDDTKVVVGAVLGGLIGGWAGATIFRTERWETVVSLRLRGS